ncbi:hypothetical protein EMIHUDRAFT_242440 [Emiliania huxleyi CCMP1516]|uniref:Uncharacterized protein n=2 Tax=Emiliania huxleyi TaxID=2903 RepID=A0A0D3J8Q4_EMIH1|nr:hypothetical protein EMIHUDRAFT_242440 [Emiliania huxleyi CCMP1516]EOD19889.1 hypothetical protein EMIHUDRAFT_242440 [Emiliania huxleyi CCMP1516]|eukprot:XP_005772318.1 hypothetical protein EMIHUDRAFT_242440 [Emiliania huxleyi CCMP1516]
MRPDGLHHTKMVSAMPPRASTSRWESERKGDSLANSNKGDRTSNHNGVLRAAQNAIRARSVGIIIIGDKENPEVTRHLNDTSVTDICELGGDFATMRDVHYKVKCWNPLIKSTTAGRGSWGQWWQCGVGGPPLRVDGPLDHSTGKGWVKDHARGKGWIKTDAGSWKWTGAQYYDAKWVKNWSRKP